MRLIHNCLKHSLIEKRGLWALIFLTVFVSCRKGNSRGSDSGNAGNLDGLGARAGDAIEAQLDEIYKITSPIPPAFVRPDPDLFARRMIRQFRNEDMTVAKEIGRVEDYRLLLGGASQDFRTIPQETYDATSLLATQKVAENVCQGLINPSVDAQPGWKTVLPFDPTSIDENLKFLAQRILGLPTSKIPAETLVQLKAVVESEKQGGRVTPASYVTACTFLAMDAEALLL